MRKHLQKKIKDGRAEMEDLAGMDTNGVKVRGLLKVLEFSAFVTGV
jgi:hypothetical protein